MTTRMLRWLTVGVAACALAACSGGEDGARAIDVGASTTDVGESTSTTAPESAAVPVTADVIADMATPPVCDHPADRLVDGQVPGIEPVYVGIDLPDRHVAVGDLTGDGVDDGAVVLTCTFGGNGTWQSAYVLVADLADEGPRLVGPVPVEEFVDSDRAPGYGEVAIAEGRLAITAYGFVPSDPNCCPSIRVATLWRVDGDSVVLDGSDLGAPIEVTAAGFGSLDLSMTYDRAAAVLGRPVAYSDPFGESDPIEAGCTSWNLVGDDRVGGVGGDGVVQSAYLYSPDFVTEGGISIGATMAEVRAAHPDAYEADNFYLDVPDLYVDGTLADGRPALLRFVFSSSEDALQLMIIGAAEYASLAEGCA